MLPRVNFGKLDSRKRHILHSLDRTQLICTCILKHISCGTKFLLEFIFADWRLVVFSGKIFAVISCYLRELIFALDYEELKKLNNP